MGTQIESDGLNPTDFDSTVSQTGPNGAVAFFQQAQHFVISGGNFTHNVMHNVSNTQDFRSIPLGDVDLQREIEDAAPRSRRGSVRRIYSARISGLAASMTAIVYQGDNAEDDWREEIARYSSLRWDILYLEGRGYLRGNTDILASCSFMV
ncbi:hypothetical protein C8F04DRAFT_1093856 [Mycena alexandri]|uniref:Uncharacterized protein n=1 Tax=Mycena alexandri TaxID=1745969 RepID=A0AAD6SZG7_9AGAR|nr:hypothetical protein C8F04DRAFT_1093856 [Mycena alexandri]